MSAGTQITPVNGRSWVRGPVAPPLCDLTIPAFLAQCVEHHPDADAVVFPQLGVRWSYSRFARRIDRLAAGLLALGLYKGDRVGIWSPNRPEWLLAQFATARIGLVLVNINPAYRRSEVEYVLNKVSAKALILAPRFKSSDYLEMLRDLAPELETATPGRLRSDRLPALRTVIQLGADEQPGMYSFDQVMDRGGGGQRSRLDAISDALSSKDAINIQFTSGTTGAPKGATLSHYNIVNNAVFCALAMDFTEHDRLCIPVPLYHCFGMVLGVLSSVATGAAMIFPGEGFDPLETLKTLAAERCTALHAVPTMFIAMLGHAEFSTFDLRAMRTGIMAGAPCPIDVMKRVVNDMHASQITIAYGMTETSPISFQSSVDDPMERRVSTVGRIHPHVEVKVIDQDGNITPVGVQGEFCTRGYSVMQGYWGDDEQTRETIDSDGWLHSGDLAIIDAEGYCNIVGRVKDMLIRGGENVYPAEIEEYLFRHDNIQSAQIFGVPDERYGEEVCAWIILQPGKRMTEDDVRDFCQGQIAHYKIPRYIRFVEEMPMTVTGKPQKFRMRELMMSELGITEEKTA
ncbi:MAG: AMP-binding protein [Rhodospirillales bacterium]|nr:AMP-binding protein [Rhodospirillales bacterium]